MALNFPTDTSSPYVDPTSGLKYVYNGAVGAWESAIQPPAIVSANQPSLTIDGFLWWDTSNSRLKVYNSASWAEIVPNISTQVTVSDTPPSGAGNGTLWWDSESGRLFIYYIDVDTPQWVVCSPLSPSNGGGVTSSTTAPSSEESAEGDLWYNITNGQLYVFTGGTWVATQAVSSDVQTVVGGTNVTVGGTASDPVVNVPDATTSVKGASGIADQATVNTATSTDQAVTPGTLATGIANYLPDASESVKGVVEIATSTEVAAGTDNGKAISPAGFKQSINNLGITNPAGSILMFGGTDAPTGFLLCDGSAVDRSTFADLFAVIGETFGAGDTSTTFNVPDLRGEFVRGWDAMGGSARGVDSGRAFGSTQNSTNLAHSHNVTDPGHAHDIAAVSDTTAAVAAGAASAGAAPSTGATDNQVTSVTIQNSGDTEARPRNIALSYIIKT